MVGSYICISNFPRKMPAFFETLFCLIILALVIIVNLGILFLMEMEKNGERNVGEKKKRASKITEEQKRLMVDFIEKHDKMIKGKFSSSFTANDSRTLWDNLAELLNSCNGAKKTGKDWRKCWQDIKRVTKSKAAEVAKHRKVTGGGEALGQGLSGVQERIRSLIPNCSVEGHTDVPESQCNLNDLLQTQENEIEVISITNNGTLAENNEILTVSFAEMLSTAATAVQISSSEANYGNIFETGHVDVILQPHEAGLEDTPTPTLQFKTPTKIPNKRKRMPASAARLQRASEATTQLAQIASAKLKLKEDYYKKKLEAMNRIAASMEAIANNLINKK